MKIINTKLKDVYIIEPQVFGDERGWFMESYSKAKTPEITCEFIQDNHSYSMEKGTLRGIHFQNEEWAQAKLVRCVRGAVLDVAVDLRRGSPTYRQWVSVELSAENKRQFFIPKGFGHGFLTVTDDVEFVYKADQYYNGESDRSIFWNDEALNINWQFDKYEINEPILSQKDKTALKLKDSDCNFKY